MLPSAAAGEALNPVFFGAPEGLLSSDPLGITGSSDELLPPTSLPEMTPGAAASGADEQIYAVQHGEQMYRGTLKEAMDKCPVIGRMALAEAQQNMEKADLMARMQQRGREKREAEEAAQALARAQPVVETPAAQPDPRAKKPTTAEHATVIAAEPAKVVAEVVVGADHMPNAAAEATRWSQAIAHNLIGSPQAPQQEAIAKVAPVVKPKPAHHRVASQKPPKAATATVKPKIIPAIESRRPAAIATPDKVVTERTIHPAPTPRPEVARLPIVAVEVAPLITKERTGEQTVQAIVEDEVQLPPIAIAEPLAVDSPTPELGPEMEALPLVTIEPSELPMLSFEPIEPLAISAAQEAITELLAPPEESMVLPAPAQEVETAITTLAIAIEQAEDNANEVAEAKPSRAKHILQEIITVTADLETATTPEAGEIADQKLAVLFEELLEEAGVEHTPQLVESLVKLARAHQLSVTASVKQAKSEDSLRLPDEVGTREFLQGLQHLVSSVTRVVRHLYGLGMAALDLYGLRLFAMSPLRTIDTFTT